MTYLSICSGIEAASVAWHPLGWHPLAFAEIEPFPSAVLAHHWPDVPNLGDMTKYADWPSLRPELIVGGTPCQAFSVAGLRKGLADPRGNLALTYLAILARYRPTWVVWENVPGVLSDRTGAFGSFLGGLAELGYGWAYRVLDAQHFGVPQRRRRVFVVGHLGDWRRAAAVLFERHSMQGHPPPSREARQIAPTIPARSAGGGGFGPDAECGGALIAGTLQANGKAAGSATQQDAESGMLVVSSVTSKWAKGTGGPAADECQNLIAHTLRGEGFDASEDGTGRGTPLVPVAFDTTQITSAANYSNPKPGDPCHPLAAGAHPPAIAFSGRARGDDGRGYDRPPMVFGSETVGTLDTVKPHCIAFPAQMSGTQCAAAEDVAPVLQAKNPTAVAFNLRGREGGAMPEVDPDGLACQRAASGGSSRSYVATSAVRRLTPRECERLQGFPDDHTLIPWRGKPADQCPDGPRYKALGNSMAVPVMRWIGERIEKVERLTV